MVRKIMKDRTTLGN